MLAEGARNRHQIASMGRWIACVLTFSMLALILVKKLAGISRADREIINVEIDFLQIRDTPILFGTQLAAQLKTAANFNNRHRHPRCSMFGQNYCDLLARRMR